MFIDASALAAILLTEPEAAGFVERIAGASERFTSAIAIYETTLAVTRYTGCSLQAAQAEVEVFLAYADISLVPICSAEAYAALHAHHRFGKGRHPARLNMGECFAYACAVTHDAPLLYKDGDFALTDVATA